MYVHEGRKLRYDVPLTIGDVTYPANWLRLSSPEQRQELGITEEPDPVTPSYDQKFFWGVDNPKALEDTPILDGEGNETGDVNKGLKTSWIQKQKDIAANILLHTDWYVTRKSETGAAIPDEVSTFRSSTRAACEQRESEIRACTTTAELASLIREGGLTEWPSSS